MFVQTSIAVCRTKKAQQMVFNQGVKQHAMLHGTKKKMFISALSMRKCLT